jgi:glycosyltransferase involved in cell wall biosynthesis
VIRSGGRFSVYRNARKYFRKNKEHYDLFVDSINTMPFLSPKLVGERTVLPIIYQRAAEIWFHEMPFPINYLLYYYFERKWLTRYKDTRTVTISKSSKEDLESIGFKKTFVVPIGLSIEPIPEITQKESNPTIVFLGRLKKYKLPDHALEAFSIIRQHVSGARLWVIGAGSMLRELQGRYNTQDITFYGHVNDELKYRLLRRAHLILVPSVREGWGLVVTEANAMGTPAIAYDVHGLKDSVIDGETGILIKDRSEESLAHAAITLLDDKDLLTKYSEKALAFSKRYRWDEAVNQFEKIINLSI